MKASKIRQKEDSTLVAIALRKSEAAPYTPNMNPHPEGTLRHDRFRRYYERDQRSYWCREYYFRDLCEAYGYQPNEG